MSTKLFASQLTIGQTGFAVPWHCFVDAAGYIHPESDATITPDGGGTRCIHVMRLSDGSLAAAFAHGVTDLRMADIRKYFKR